LTFEILLGIGNWELGIKLKYMPFLTNMQNGFGLDIGDRSIKLLRLAMKKTFLHKRKFIVKNFAKIEMPEGVIENGEIKDEAQLQSHLKSLLEKAGELPSKAVVVSMPETKTFLKILEITAQTKKEISEKIIEQLPTAIPVSPEEIYFDWQILKSDEKLKKDKKAPSKYTILLVAALKTTVDSFLKVINNANLTPIAFESEAIALSRAMLGNNQIDSKSRAIIDLGATQTSLIITEEGAPTMSISVPISGNQITETIAEKLKIPFVEAEKLKKACGLDTKKCNNVLLPIIDLSIKNICKKIYNALKTYPNFFEDKKTQPIILSGGGANMLKLDTVLSRNLKIKTRQGTPLEIWSIESKNKDFNESVLEASTVIGLALRAVLYPFPNTH
jgi:type IV pilus assembly protein PilM